jgi:hypothetical protein
MRAAKPTLMVIAALALSACEAGNIVLDPHPGETGIPGRGPTEYHEPEDTPTWNGFVMSLADSAPIEGAVVWFKSDKDDSYTRADTTDALGAFRLSAPCEMVPGAWLEATAAGWLSSERVLVGCHSKRVDFVLEPTD